MADNRNNMLEKVKERLDIVELVSEYVNLKKSGSNYLGLCPFHNEKTPSFTVSDSKQIFHCFGCGAGGDGITFIMKRENLDFVDTLKFLADKYNIPWEDSTGAPASELKQIFYEINRAAARFFHSNLYTDKIALQYLKNRGIEEEVFRRFGLGYASESFDKLLINLKEDGFSESDIEKTGLIGIRKDVSGFYDKFRNRLIFPIIDTRGRVIGFGGRVLDRSLPKYLNSPDTVVFNKGYHLYGLNIIAKNKSRKRIMLVEGYMDVISLNAKGIDYAVASLGTALTEYQGKLLKRYGDEVYICYDSDAAGVRAAIRAIDVLQKLDVDPKIVMLPEGEDPDDFIKANSVVAFEKKVEESLNFMDFKVYILKKRFDLTQAEDKIKFTQEAARMIRELKSPVQQNVYIDKLSEETGIAREAIMAELRTGRKFKNMPSTGVTTKTKPEIQPARQKAETDLIGLMLIDKNIYEIVSEKLSDSDFEDPDCRFCLRLIAQEYKSKDILDIDRILTELEFDEKDSDRLAALLSAKPQYTSSNIEVITEDLIRTIKTDQLESKKREITEKIKELEKTGSLQEIKHLMEELTEIIERIHLIS